MAKSEKQRKVSQIFDVTNSPMKIVAKPSATWPESITMAASLHKEKQNKNLITIELS